ncbi:hypothetical protein ACC758_38135, partial [Rhizobium ruizarguesonis]
WFNIVFLNPELHQPTSFVQSYYFVYMVGAIVCLSAMIGLCRFVANIRRIYILETGVVAVDATGAKRFIDGENRRRRYGSGANFLAGKAVLRISDAYGQAAV